MKDRIVTCPNCENESLLVRGDTTWCFSGCSIFKLIDVPAAPGVVPELTAPVALIRSAPTTSTTRPMRVDVNDRDDWSSPSEEQL